MKKFRRRLGLFLASVLLFTEAAGCFTVYGGSVQKAGGSALFDWAGQIFTEEES